MSFARRGLVSGPHRAQGSRMSREYRPSSLGLRERSPNDGRKRWSQTKSGSSTIGTQEIMDQLRAEPSGVQIMVAFGMLFEVLNHSMRNEPDETKLAVAQ